MGAGPLQNRSAQGSVSPCIKINLAVHPCKYTVFITAQGKCPFHGVALGMEIDGLLPGKHNFYRTLYFNGRQRRDMLGRYVFFSSESAAHQLVLHYNPFRIPSQHNGNLMPGIIDALISGVYFYSVLIREGHRALGLQKRMLGKGRGIFLRHHISGLCQRLFRVSSCHMAALAQIPAGMNFRRILSHCFMDICYRLQFFIFDFHQLFGLFQCVSRLSHHQTDGVSHTAGNAAFCNHHVPVLLQMSYFIIRHVLRRQHCQHARQGKSLFIINIQNPGPWITGAYCRCIHHAFHLHIVRVFAVPQNFLPHIQAERLFPDTVVHSLFQIFLYGSVAPEYGRGQLNPFYDLLIAGTAADISFQSRFDLFFCRIRHPVNQRLSCHHHARNAESALDRSPGAESIYKSLLLLLAQPLCRQNAASHGKLRGQHTGFHRFSVHHNRTGPAGALAASVFY